MTAFKNYVSLFHLPAWQIVLLFGESEHFVRPHYCWLRNVQLEMSHLGK